MKIIQTDKLVIKSWCENPEQGAIDQATNLARLPFAHHHIALMPDTHQGYGHPIGGVAACRGVVIPNSVGVDIGCGMLAIKTSLTGISIPELKEIMGSIRTLVPVGFSHHKSDQIDFDLEFGNTDHLPVISEERKSASRQIGTLGGGNHFIEIQRDSKGCIWFMIHSGSRNLGFKVAKHYNDLAIGFNEKYFSLVPTEWELAFLPQNSQEYVNYLAEMEVCLQFALKNRKRMAEQIKCAFLAHIQGITFSDEINIHHNYAAMEHHFGHNVMVHRKGATRAREGELGLIPGSQGTSSYVVKGRGNTESFMSCSHGAGRKMGRKEAVRSLDFEQEKKRLDDRGIVHSIRNKEDLEEASGAYKDIDIVMKEQEDLVEIVEKLEPLAVIKG